jgi:homoserine O-acetyltransferase
METIYIGQGRALDPSKYFMILVNQIGNGLSSAPSNTPFPSDGPRFPKVRIGDDVRAQHKLVTEKFGLDSLALVVGGSMGAQQTWEWAVRYPDMVKRAAPIAGTAKNTTHCVVFGETLKEAITSDPAFQDGAYAHPGEVHRGLMRHAKLWAVMGWSTEFFYAGRMQDLGFSSLDDFVTNFMFGYFGVMDPNNLLTMAWKWQHGDVSRHTGGDLAAALGRIKAKTLVLPIDEDMFFPPRDSAREQELTPNSTLKVLKSIDGHLALFGTDAAMLAELDAHLADLLATPVEASAPKA